MAASGLISFIFLTLAFVLTIPRIAVAAESCDSCTGFITSLPAVISAPGRW